MVDRWVGQFDGGRYEGLDCVAAADASELYRATQGRVNRKARDIRALTGDTVGGLTLDQVRSVNRTYYGIVTPQYNRYDFDNLRTMSAHRGFVILIRYATIQNTKYDCFRHNFSGNHGIYIAGYVAGRGWKWSDPGADGRYPGCPRGFQYVPTSLMRQAAGLLVSDLQGHRLGAGYAQVMFTPPDPTKRYRIVIHPPADQKYRRFGDYTVIDNVYHPPARIRRTGGLSAACSGPIRVRWPGHSDLRLVQVRDSHSVLNGRWVSASFAHEV